MLIGMKMFWKFPLFSFDEFCSSLKQSDKVLFVPLFCLTPVKLPHAVKVWIPLVLLCDEGRTQVFLSHFACDESKCK